MRKEWICSLGIYTNICFYFGVIYGELSNKDWIIITVLRNINEVIVANVLSSKYRNNKTSFK